MARVIGCLVGLLLKMKNGVSKTTMTGIKSHIDAVWMRKWPFIIVWKNYSIKTLILPKKRRGNKIITPQSKR
ncbi:hypothetical protein ACL2XP_21805 [Sodalis sp. RH21]|uniref:hypothetical protein n=1 Tax=unclassified Sodalis (in: enterobacteria) TaxID=2636512 RepID=UPI0039B3DAC6